MLLLVGMYRAEILRDVNSVQLPNTLPNLMNGFMLRLSSSIVFNVVLRTERSFSNLLLSPYNSKTAFSSDATS